MYVVMYMVSQHYTWVFVHGVQVCMTTLQQS